MSSFDLSLDISIDSPRTPRDQPIVRSTPGAPRKQVVCPSTPKNQPIDNSNNEQCRDPGPKRVSRTFSV